MEPIRTLLEGEEFRGAAVLPPELQRLYGGDLRFPAASGGRPYVMGNFVATLDGVVTYQIPGMAGGGEISGHDSADRFLMGLLRASADAVMIGASTLDATSPEHVWTGAHIYPEAAESYATYRREILGKPKRGLTVVVSGSGAVDLSRAAFRHPDSQALILTTSQGEAGLRKRGIGESVEVRALGEAGGRIPPEAMLQLLREEYGVGLLLHEGGPKLFGAFVAPGLVDEFFLTVAPQIAGRSLQRPRPGFIWGTEFLPENAPWLRLASVKQRGDHLYLRYRASPREMPPGGSQLPRSGLAV